MKIIPVWQGGVSISCFSMTYSQGMAYLENTRARDTLERKSPSTTTFCYNGYDLFACLDFRDSPLQIKMYYQFEGVFEIDETHRSISICPRHQDAFGIRCSN